MQNQKLRELSVEMSGAGRLEVSGMGERLVVNSSGAGRYDGGDFRVREAEVRLSGASRTVVFAEDLLKVSASGAARVEYKGNARVEKAISGVSSIRSL